MVYGAFSDVLEGISYLWELGGHSGLEGVADTCGMPVFDGEFSEPTQVHWGRSDFDLGEGLAGADVHPGVDHGDGPTVPAACGDGLNVFPAAVDEGRSIEEEERAVGTEASRGGVEHLVPEFEPRPIVQCAQHPGPVGAAPAQAGPHRDGFVQVRMHRREGGTGGDQGGMCPLDEVRPRSGGGDG